MNKIDRMVGYFSPKKALKRIQTRSHLQAVSNNNAGAYSSDVWYNRVMSNWLPGLKSGKSEQNQGQRNLSIARAYDAYKNQSLARATIKRIKEGTVATGLAMCPTIHGELIGLTDKQTIELEDTIEREFCLFAKTCDIEKTSTLDGITDLAFGTMLIAGDSFVNTHYQKDSKDPYTLKLQVIDPARVRNPKEKPDTKGMYGGVEVDQYGAPIKYHITKAHPALSFQERQKTLEWQSYRVFGESTGRRRFFHLFDKDIPEQLRAPSIISGIAGDLKQLSRYSEAELMATVLTSYMTVILENNNPDENYGWQGKSDKKNRTGGKNMDLSYGAFIELPNGRKVSQVTPTRPNQAYEKFVLAMLRHLSAGLSIPMDELLLKFDKSYSASRASMLKAYQIYKIYRKKLAEMFLDGVFGLWFDEAVVSGTLPYISNYADIRRREIYQGHIWIGQGRGAIDEVDEANAATIRVKNSFSSDPIEAAELKGVSLRTIQRQQARALRRAEILGLKYNTGDSVTIDSNRDKRDNEDNLGGNNAE